MILKCLTTLSWVLLSNYETWLISDNGFETFAYGFTFECALRFSLSVIVSEIWNSGSLFCGFFQFLSPSSLGWTLTKKWRIGDLIQVKFPRVWHYLHLSSTSRSRDTIGTRTLTQWPAQARDLVVYTPKSIQSCVPLLAKSIVNYEASLFVEFPVASLQCFYGRKIIIIIIRIRKEKQEKLKNNKIHHRMVNFNKKGEAGEIEKQ